MRRSRALLLAACSLGVGALVAPGAASAAGCPSEQSVLPYSKNDPPYQCAQTASSGKKSIKPWDTKTWARSTALGYEVKSHCYNRSDSDVSVTEAWAPASYSATATNWDPNGTRHWAAGVLFTTGNVDSSGYSNGCNSKGQISNSIQRITELSLSSSGASGSAQTFTASVSPSSAPGAVVLRANGQPIAQAVLSGGKATLTATLPPGSYKVDAAYMGDTSACPTRESSCGYTPSESKKIEVVIAAPNTTASAATADEPTDATGEATPVEPAGTASTAGSGTSTTSEAAGAPVATAAAAATTWRKSTFGLTTTTRTAKLSQPLVVRCPKGSVLMHAEALTSGSADAPVAEGLHRARVAPTKATRGERVTLQATCRQTGLPRLIAKGIGYGTERADRLSTATSGGTLFGGPGRDRLVARHAAGVAIGGLGDDVILVDGADGVGRGGAGDDRLVARGSGRVLLVGGPGHDTFEAGAALTLVNAVDGRRDRIVCTSADARVMADRHDVLVGACKVRR